MALIIEDGSIVADANSYVEVADARAYATARGVTLPVADAEVEALLIRAMDFLEAQRASYQGHKTDPANQRLQWPRSGVVIDCSYALPDNIIPRELKDAQMQLVIEANGGISLMPSSDGRVVKKEKADVLEREFMTGADLGTSGLPKPSMPAVDLLLAPLFTACGGGFALKTVRV